MLILISYTDVDSMVINEIVPLHLFLPSRDARPFLLAAGTPFPESVKRTKLKSC